MGCLNIDSLSIHFGGLGALNRVSFQVDQGQIYAIIGPNGAGKSTLFNCITGFYKASEGKVLFQGEEITNRPPHLIQRRGVARTFQNLGLFRTMTVLENLLVAKHHGLRGGILRGAALTRRVRQEEKKVREEAEELLELLELKGMGNRVVSELPFGYQKLTEIARALALCPSLLLIDEPATGMNPKEKEFLTETIFALNRQRKITVIVIEHDMRFIMRISGRICVLNYGKKIAEGTPEEIQANQEVIEAYLGRKKDIKCQ